MKPAHADVTGQGPRAPPARASRAQTILWSADAGGSAVAGCDLTRAHTILWSVAARRSPSARRGLRGRARAKECGTPVPRALPLLYRRRHGPYESSVRAGCYGAFHRRCSADYRARHCTRRGRARGPESQHGHVLFTAAWTVGLRLEILSPVERERPRADSTRVLLAYAASARPC